MKKIFACFMLGALLSSTLNAMHHRYIVNITSQLQKNNEIIHSKTTEYVIEPYVLERHDIYIKGWDEEKYDQTDDLYIIATDIKKIIPTNTSHHFTLQYSLNHIRGNDNARLCDKTVYYLLPKECETSPHKLTLRTKEGNTFDITIRVLKKIDGQS